MENYIMGEKIGDIMKMIHYVRSQGYGSFEEYLLHKEHPKEYNATVNLLKARLGRIQKLAEEMS